MVIDCLSRQSCAHWGSCVSYLDFCCFSFDKDFIVKLDSFKLLKQFLFSLLFLYLCHGSIASIFIFFLQVFISNKSFICHELFHSFLCIRFILFGNLPMFELFILSLQLLLGSLLILRLDLQFLLQEFSPSDLMRVLVKIVVPFRLGFRRNDGLLSL